MEAYHIDAERQKALLLITKKLLFFTFISLSSIAVFFFAFSSLFETRTYLTLVVFASGLVGGFVSIQQRLPKAELKELIELSKSWASILLVPLNGGIFALILHILFISGILIGPLFPEYIIPEFKTEDPIRNYNNFLMGTFPKTGEDIAKLIFWSFVAGFSERFVPQIIRKTTDRIPDNANPPGL